MIQNVNHKDFEAFGTVFAEKGQLFSLANGHSVAVSPMEATMYETYADTWLSSEAGIAVLSVSTEDGAALDFYLDRTLRLKPGIRFCLSAIGGNAMVQMAGALLPRVVQIKAPTNLEVRQKLKIRQLCTLLHQEKEPGFLFPGEAHSMLELTYVDSGSIHSVADGKDILLEQGDMVLYGENQWHTQHAERNTASRLVTITFDAEGVELNELYNRRLHAPPKAVTILQEMLREQERMDRFSEDMLIALLQALVLTLLRDEDNRLKTEETVPCLTSENQVIRQVQQYIAAHVMEKLSVPLVAEQAQVSPSYLTALFHRHLQISPGEYIRRMKLQKSKQLIREGNMNFTEIAKALEYSTIYHFSRQFKQMFGVTPSEYAKSVQ